MLLGLFNGINNPKSELPIGPAILHMQFIQFFLLSISILEASRKTKLTKNYKKLMNFNKIYALISNYLLLGSPSKNYCTNIDMATYTNEFKIKNKKSFLT
eukprot:Mrub_10636.p2 GENE.Mrub_10636~~Mrub_10636.p2  ORF type:complete len:100 (-),score=3.60 Mrub_10636:37-336(-)